MMASMTRRRRPQESELTAKRVQHSVAMDLVDGLFGRASKRFAAIFSLEGTFLDSPERLSIAGRAATKLSN